MTQVMEQTDSARLDAGEKLLEHIADQLQSDDASEFECVTLRIGEAHALIDWYEHIKSRLATVESSVASMSSLGNKAQDALREERRVHSRIVLELRTALARAKFVADNAHRTSLKLIEFTADIDAMHAQERRDDS